MDFIESTVLHMPDISDKLAELAESAKTGKNKALIVEIASIHEGTTSNHTQYSSDELTKSVDSWTTPYPRPIIINHDRASDPLGRVINAKMDKESDGTPFIRLQVMVSDPTAIERVKDGRYLTGSVGGAAGKANCSICEADWSEATMFGPVPCEHKRGKEYDGKTATLKMSNIEFKEYSFVNTPADSKSQVLKIGESENANDQQTVSALKFFQLDLDAGSVFQITESKDVDVLAKLPDSKASAIYENLKSVFLSSLLEDDKSEDNMEEETTEDVLEALASLNEEDDEVEDTPDEDSDVEDDDTEEPEVEVEDEPEVDEDVVADTEDSDEVDSDEEIEDETHDEPIEDDEAEESEVEVDTELSEKVTALELRVEELEHDKAALTEKNTQLKAALKKMLAEHAVDTRIDAGLASEDEREELIVEFSARSVQSLVDSIKDSQSATKMRTDTSITKITSQTLAIKDDEPIKEDDKLDPEQIFVDVLLGRRSL